MLDPSDWTSFRALAHRMLDDSLDTLEDGGERLAWRPVPRAVKAALDEPLPHDPAPLETVYDDFRAHIEPYSSGNRHARFLAWVQGNGTPSGMLADMLASTLNANCGGREHAAVYVERTVIGWCREIFGFPASTTGILTSGTSLANLIAVLAARRARLGPAVRSDGAGDRRLVAYTSRHAHACVASAFDICGLGERALRRIGVDTDYRIDIDELRATIARDRVAGVEPFAVIATAGSVDTGAIDDLDALADLCADQDLWLHVDGAFGTLAMLTPAYRPRLRGIERADSLAFDFHKWLHVPYDAACVLVRDGSIHRATFAHDAAYLSRATEGTAAGDPWFCDFGPELSRRFRALGVWFAFKEHGTHRLGATIERNCRQATMVADLIETTSELRLAAPVSLNIVCFRFEHGDASRETRDAMNAAIAVDLQVRGTAVVSTTRIDGRTALRMCIVNHRVEDDDLRAIIETIVQSGRRIAAEGVTALPYA